MTDVYMQSSMIRYDNCIFALKLILARLKLIYVQQVCNPRTNILEN